MKHQTTIKGAGNVESLPDASPVQSERSTAVFDLADEILRLAGCEARLAAALDVNTKLRQTLNNSQNANGRSGRENQRLRGEVRRLKKKLRAIGREVPDAASDSLKHQDTIVTLRVVIENDQPASPVSKIYEVKYPKDSSGER